MLNGVNCGTANEFNCEGRVNDAIYEVDCIQSLRNIGRINRSEVCNGEPGITIVRSHGVDIHTRATEYAGVLVKNVILYRTHFFPSPSATTIPVVLDEIASGCGFGTAYELNGKYRVNDTIYEVQGIQSLRNKRRIKHAEVLNREPNSVSIVFSSGVDIHTPATEYAGVLVNDVIHHRIHLNPSPIFSTVPVVLDVVVNGFGNNRHSQNLHITILHFGSGVVLSEMTYHSYLHTYLERIKVSRKVSPIAFKYLTTINAVSHPEGLLVTRYIADNLGDITGNSVQFFGVLVVCGQSQRQGTSFSAGHFGCVNHNNGRNNRRVVGNFVQLKCTTCLGRVASKAVRTIVTQGAVDTGCTIVDVYELIAVFRCRNNPCATIVSSIVIKRSFVLHTGTGCIFLNSCIVNSADTIALYESDMPQNRSIRGRYCFTGSNGLVLQTIVSNSILHRVGAVGDQIVSLGQSTCLRNKRGCKRHTYCQ